MKYVFIVNPKAGKGRTLNVIKQIEKVCIKDNIDYKIHYTKKPKEAIKITKKYKNEENIIFSVGGDGTLNEVLNGIIGTKNILGVVPSGSGNDFYKTLDFMTDGIHKIDVGVINKKYFLNVASIGIDAEICDNTGIMKKLKLPRKQIYNASIIYTFFKYKFKDINFNIDDDVISDKCTLLTICNGKTYGGGFKIAPKASLTDGYFDVYFVKKMSKFKIPFLFGKLLKGTHENSKLVKKMKANNIKFKCNHKLVCEYDGEILIDNKFNISLLEKKVSIFNDKKLIDRFMRG